MAPLSSIPLTLAPQQGVVSGHYQYGGTPTYQGLQQAEQRGVLQQFSEKEQAAQSSASKRGISRSGFAGEQQSQIGAQEEGALAQVNAGITDRLMQYQYQQDQVNLLAKQVKMQQSAQRNQWIGAALSVVGSVAGGLI